jgi:hypothetical protein
VQRDVCDRDTLRAKQFEECRIEMKAGGGRRDRTRHARVHRLVARLVIVLRRMRDVRRERHFAQAIHHFEHVAVEAQLEEVALAAEHFGIDSLRKRDPPPRLERLAGARLHQRSVSVDHALDQHLDFTARVLAAVQPRLHHPRIVQHQNVVRAC